MIKLLVALLTMTVLQAQDPWEVDLPRCVRTLYVAPGGTGDGTSRDTPLSRDTALDNTGCQAGDCYEFAEGTYGTLDSSFSFACTAGTSDLEVVWQARKG